MAKYIHHLFVLVNPGNETEASVPKEMVGIRTMTIAVQNDTDMNEEPLVPTENH
jgi:hypothetical protein